MLRGMTACWLNVSSCVDRSRSSQHRCLMGGAQEEGVPGVDRLPCTTASVFVKGVGGGGGSCEDPPGYSLPLQGTTKTNMCVGQMKNISVLYGSHRLVYCSTFAK